MSTRSHTSRRVKFSKESSLLVLRGLGVVDARELILIRNCGLMMTLQPGVWLQGNRFSSREAQMFVWTPAKQGRHLSQLLQFKGFDTGSQNLPRVLVFAFR
jgi:hypothetical protein